MTDDVDDKKGKLQLSDAEWRARLDPARYRVLRQQGTEPAFSGEYYEHHEPGVYLCGGCGEALFSADTKYESGSGWPSFFAPIDASRIEEVEDDSHGMRRVEIKCARCGGHLGHVFPDGPRPTGARYCVNSLSLKHERK